MLKNISWSIFTSFTHPILIISAGDDEVAPENKTKALFKKCDSNDIKFQVIKRARHNVHLGNQRETLKCSIINWINKRIPDSLPVGNFSKKQNSLYHNRRIYRLLRGVVVFLIYLKGLQ